MNILTKLTLRFSAIVASILTLFSVAVFVFSASFRSGEFYDRLESRAMTTARLLVTVQEVDKALLRIIDQNSIPALPEEQVLIFDKNNELDYSSVESTNKSYPPELLERVRREERILFKIGDIEQVGLMYRDGEGEFVVMASAYDRFGRRKLKNLRTILLIGWLVGIGITVPAGLVFAKQGLAPLAKMNNQVANINAGNLDRRLDEGNRTDEIARLAMNFNLMLLRLETAFEMQQSFVANASHELRTPLAVMRSQLQVTLSKKRVAGEYRATLQSLLDDTDAFARLTTGLLQLAQSDVENQRFRFKPCRVDEALFTAQEELAKLHPNYHFQMDYAALPDDEEALTIPGNEQMLSIAFLNFMDNACKFSPDHTVQISLISTQGRLEIRFSDNGLGIPLDEQEKIYNAFHRAANVQGIAKGHGIGLSLCQKIVQLHSGEIQLKSAPGKGSVFIVRLPLQPPN
ncbi:MAG: HAMP domain-containing protein [Saprospiraceae bacterium]|nr:HAMP domain-containing protein [Saprospiraceae bacterium]MCF8250506.1 HAMP domain-containing protein [Saprospiraceae bacterium]MCF8279646.1 HAMP domain-containing protein [Bacteroidales bacterium]MCF8312432.1 HAMP domain-containing protein [Saprospiraceae bacterium]MCF8440751.1 HAMP domain-containing protein [Saprospiraceae bacterium]